MSEYIDRDAVKDMLKRECSPRVMAYLVDELCEIPAADVRPVVRGRWETKQRHEHYPSGEAYEVDYCSVCGKRGSKEFLYCPNCGADMRPTSMSGANEEE